MKQEDHFKYTSNNNDLPCQQVLLIVTHVDHLKYTSNNNDLPCHTSFTYTP